MERHCIYKIRFFIMNYFERHKIVFLFYCLPTDVMFLLIGEDVDKVTPGFYIISIFSIRELRIPKNGQDFSGFRKKRL